MTTAVGFNFPTPRRKPGTTTRKCLAAQLAAQPLFSIWLLLLPLLPPAWAQQLPSLQAAQARFPGCCPGSESFDCGDGHCLSVSRFHDGKADCADASDEFCLPGQIQCGRFCADPLHLGECLRNPNCSQTAAEPAPPIFCPLLKRRLCGVANTISCRGYGECIFVKWLMDGKRDCLDGSDENAEYASIFKVNPLREQLLGPAPPPPPPAPAPPATWPTWPPLPFLLTQPAKTTSAITTTTTTTTTTVMLQTPLREGLGASSSGTPSIWEPMGGEGQWHPRPGQGKEFSGATNQPLPPLIPDQSTEHPSAGGEIGGGDGKASLRLVESTEPGPWQNPPLDDFGGEFARLLVTPSTLAGEWLPPTTSRTETDRQRMEVEKAIVFPVWPTQESSSRGMGAGKLWPGPSGVLKEEDGKKPTWPLTTPKYPFDRGKIGVENAGFPFSRPERPTERTETTKSWETHQPTMATRAENGATERHGKPADIWMPEGGSRTGNAGVPEKGKAAQGLKLKEEEEEQMAQSEKPAQAFTDRTEETSEGPGMVLTKEPTTTPAAPASASVAPAQPVETVETTELSSTSSAEGEQSAEPTNSISTLGGGGPATPMPPQQGWWTPLDWRSLDQVKENLSSQQPGLNCSETVKRMGQQLLPEAAAQRCQCPAGQMRQSNGQCQLAPISTFRVRMDSLCATNKWGDDISLEEQLTLLKMAASLQGQPVCVRDVLDERVIVLNTVCQPTDCSIQDLAAKMQDSDVLPEVKLRIGELPDGACSQFDLNDCEEKAECLVQGLRYRCRCLPGTNDTSDGAGRSCEGTVISMTCTKFLGVCVLVWLLMLLLLCFLLPTISFLCFKYCCEEHPLRERLEYQWHRFKAKMRGQKHLLPIITTSAAPSAGGQRRESAPGPSEFGVQRSSDTLKVPAVMEGPRPYQPPARQQTQTDSEDYLIMEEDEEGIEPEVEEIVEETARERQQRRESGVDRAQEEESGGGRGGGRGKGTSRQQTEQSSSAGTAAGITAGATGAVVAAQQKPEDTTTKNGGQHQQQAQAAATSTAVVASSETRPPTEEGKGRGVPEPQPERPASVASRAGTPTIWDQFRILGDQYTRLVQIDERRESRNSLEELLEKSKERERSGRMDEAERMKDELDAELRLRRGGEQKELEEDREGEEAVEVAEPGRSMPAPEFGLLPPGALNIGWGFADDIDIPRQIQAGSLPSVPPPRRQFVPKPIREGAARRRAAEETRLSSGSTVVKVPAGQQQRRAVKAGDFVVVKGRRVDREKQRRRLEKLGTPKKEAKSKVEGTSERRDRMRRFRDQKTLEDSLELQQKEDLPKPGRQRPTGVFDPDLPSTSQHQAESVGNQLPRTKETTHEHSAEYLRRRFHTHGRALQAIEEQIEQKVHTGCIVGGRKPWDLSPRPDSLDWLPPLHRRELTQSDEGGLAESQERIESRVHFGCITDRKPWDSSPYRESAIPPRRGRSEYDLRGAGIDQQRLAERRQRRLHSSSNSPSGGGRGGRGSSAAGARGRGTTATLGPAPNWLELD